MTNPATVPDPVTSAATTLRFASPCAFPPVVMVDDLPVPANARVTVERPHVPAYVRSNANITLNYAIRTPADKTLDDALMRAIMPRAGVRLKVHTVAGVPCFVIAVEHLRPDPERRTVLHRTIKFVEYRKPVMPKPPQYGRLRYHLWHKAPAATEFVVTRGRKQRVGFIMCYADGRYVSRMVWGVSRVTCPNMRAALQAFEFTWHAY